MSLPVRQLIQTMPHPTTLSLNKRVWICSVGTSNTVAGSGSKITTWKRKLTNGLTFANGLSVNQPARSGNEIVWNDPANNQWLNAGANYLFVDSSHSGISLFFLIKNSQVSPGGGQFKFAFDAGNLATKGFGVFYASNEIGCYTPSDHGGKLTLKRPVNNPTTDYVVAGCVIKFGDSQKLYINNQLEISENITLTQLTATEVSMQSTPGGAGGPVTLGSGAKANQPSTRWFGGAIKAAIIVDEAVNDLQRNWIYHYLMSQKAA